MGVFTPMNDNVDINRLFSHLNLQQNLKCLWCDIESKYEIKKRLGSGGFGSVYAATRIVDVKPVALKVVQKEKVCGWATVNGVTLPKEIVLMKQVQHIPGVIKLLEFFEVTDQTSYVLVLDRPEPVQDLFDYITERGALTEEISRRFFRQVVQILLHVHGCGVIHRDIKDENLLVDLNTKELLLIDFGSGDHLRLDRDYVDYDAVKDLIRQCLSYRPEDRPQLEELLNHPWMTRGSGASSGRRQSGQLRSVYSSPSMSTAASAYGGTPMPAISQEPAATPSRAAELPRTDTNFTRILQVEVAESSAVQSSSSTTTPAPSTEIISVTTSISEASKNNQNDSSSIGPLEATSSPMIMSPPLRLDQPATTDVQFSQKLDQAVQQIHNSVQKRTEELRNSLTFCICGRSCCSCEGGQRVVGLGGASVTVGSPPVGSPPVSSATERKAGAHVTVTNQCGLHRSTTVNFGLCRQDSPAVSAAGSGEDLSTGIQLNLDKSLRHRHDSGDAADPMLVVGGVAAMDTAPSSMSSSSHLSSASTGSNDSSGHTYNLRPRKISPAWLLCPAEMGQLAYSAGDNVFVLRPADMMSRRLLASCELVGLGATCPQTMTSELVPRI